MDDLLERLKEQLRDYYGSEAVVQQDDLRLLIYEYEIETGRRRPWNDERWN